MKKINRRKFIKSTGSAAAALALPSLSLGAKADLKKYKGTEITLLGHPTHHIEGIVQFGHIFTELTGIKVNVDLYDEPTQKSKQVLDYNTRRGDYDAALVPFMFLKEYVKAGYVEPIDEYMENDPVAFDNKPFDLKDHPLWCTIPFREGLNPNGRLYSIGQCAYIPQMTYRSDYMDKLGLEVPDTIDDYTNKFLAGYDNAGSVVKGDFYPVAIRGSSTFDSYYSFGGIANAFGDPRLVDLETNTPFPDREGWITALTWISDVLKKYGHPGQATMGWTDLIPFMQAGKIGSWIDHSGYHAVWQLAPESKIPNATTYGPPLQGRSGRRVSSCPYTDAWVMNRDCNNKGATWYFIAWSVSNHRFMMELEADLKYDLPNVLTINSDLYRSKIAANNLGNWFDMWSSGEFGGLLLDDIDKMVSNFSYYPRDERVLQLIEAYQVEASEVLAGRQTPERAIDRAGNNILKILT